MMEDKKDAADFVPGAVKKFTLGWEYDRRNKDLAYEALRFMVGDGQWDHAVRREREQQGRPCQTINRCPAFVKQVSNDIRMSQPAIRVIVTGGIADNEPNEKRRDKLATEAAELRQALMLHVENRSDAVDTAYAKAADDVVTCGYGAVRVITEYASETSLVQELRILPVDDPIGIVWDPEGRMPTREDARYCFVPVDMTREAFTSAFPGKQPAELTGQPKDFAGNWNDWVGTDTVRVAEYWYKKQEKQPFVVYEGRLIPADDPDAKGWLAAGGQAIERETTCVYRALITATEVIEAPKKWPGRKIPIVPVFGEETQIGRERRRWGLIENIKDAQRRYNYFSSAHTEIVALQPKSPFIGTQKQFEGFEDAWSRANIDNLPFLPFNPDPQSPGQPQRSQPPVSSQGISDGIALAAEEMKAITGIYDAALGQKSNETSGKAIMARQRESDVGSYVYIQNFGRAIRHLGRILLDLMPRIYDTTRIFRVMGADGRVNAISINQPAGPSDVQAEAAMLINDISAGEYDVVLEQGPSFTTKREEAKAGMVEFVRAFPDVMQVAGDLVAQSQDWPNKEEFSKRLRAVIPPAVLEAADRDEADEPAQPMMPQVPPEVMQQQMEQAAMAQQTAIAEAQKSQTDAVKASAEAERLRLSIERERIALEAEQNKRVIEAEMMGMRYLADLQAKQAELVAKLALMQPHPVVKEEAEEVEPEGPSEAQMALQAAVDQIGQMIADQQAAMQQMAAVMAAPKRVIRDDRNMVSGVETVMPGMVS